jgi:hypothetical protein
MQQVVFIMNGDTQMFKTGRAQAAMPTTLLHHTLFQHVVMLTYVRNQGLYQELPIILLFANTETAQLVNGQKLLLAGLKKFRQN